MPVRVEIAKSSPAPGWDLYVQSHPCSTLYHLSGWLRVIQQTYGHETYYLTAFKADENINPVDKENQSCVVGILPLVHMEHFLFGNSLLSIPFFDFGGILADNDQAEKALLEKAIALARQLKTDHIELRHTRPLLSIKMNSRDNVLNPIDSLASDDFSGVSYVTRTHKVRMLMELPESSDILMRSFKSKLRSQIKKPVKEGCYVKTGGMDLLNDFYKVFLINMRDLGSPVHSKKMMINTLREFSDNSRVFVVYKDRKPLACSLTIGFKGVLENPWASSLKQYSRLNPNMFLYWSMLEDASDNGYRQFDFGRSTPGEGSYKFKEQWGAAPETLHWNYFSLKGETVKDDADAKSKFDRAVYYWKKLPVSLTRILGPLIRKHIGL
jgi:FemAB-related protein (PEP-CTERM system-associated)